MGRAEFNVVDETKLGGGSETFSSYSMDAAGLIGQVAGFNKTVDIFAPAGKTARLSNVMLRGPSNANCASQTISARYTDQSSGNLVFMQGQLAGGGATSLHFDAGYWLTSDAAAAIPKQNTALVCSDIAFDSAVGLRFNLAAGTSSGTFNVSDGFYGVVRYTVS